MRFAAFIVLAACALLAGASATTESADAVARARAGFVSLPKLPSLPSIPSIPSPSSLFNDAKDAALRGVNAMLPSVDSLKNSIGNPVKTAISNIQSSTTGQLNQALKDTQNWVNTNVNGELSSMLSALDTAKNGLSTEINSLKNLAETARAGLNDLYTTLKRMMTSTFTLTVNVNCPLPTALGQINTLAKDYAGINSLIAQDKWCTVVALMEKIRGGGSISVNRAPAINAGASSFLERVSELHRHNIHSSSFMEAAAGMQVRVGDLAYSCPKMLSASDALEGGFNAAHLMVSAIDSNVLDEFKIQQVLGFLGVMIRASTTIMRSICGFYKKLDASC